LDTGSKDPRNEQKKIKGYFTESGAHEMIFYNPGVKEGPVDDTGTITTVLLLFKTFAMNASKVIF
jgi:hypothetical protein